MSARSSGVPSRLTALGAAVPLALAPVVLVPAATAAEPVAAVSVLADFEDGPPPGFFAYAAAGFDVVEVAADSPEALPDQTGPARVLSYGFDLAAPGSYGGVGQNLTTPRDWSAFDGVQLWLRGTGSGAELQVEIFDGGTDADASERFDFTIVDDAAGWELVQIPWSSFARATDYQPTGVPDDGLDLTTMWGFALPAVSGTATVLVDDISVYSTTPVTPTVSLTGAAISVAEGSGADVTVGLDVASSETVTVDYSTADGTATAGEDYTATTGTVTFAPGETTQSIAVATTPDDEAEVDETLTVSLSSPAGASLGAPTSATLTILDDDTAPTGPPPGPLTIVDDFEQPLPTGSEGSVPTGWFTAQDPSGVVAFSTSSTPPAPVPGSAGTNTVLEATYDVQSFGVVVHNFTDETATTWQPRDWSSSEGIGFWMYGSGTGDGLFLDVMDNRNAGSTTDDAERFVVNFTDDWTGWEYKRFGFDEFARKEIGNGAPNDGFNRTDVHGYAIGALRTDGPRTYLVDDVAVFGEAAPPPLAVGFDRDEYTPVEGEPAIAVVRLNRPADSDVTVAYATSDATSRTATEDLSATLDRDYTAASGAVTIPAGEREATITVPTLQNAKHEVDETFLLALSDPTGAELGFITTAAVSIQDDDTVDPRLVDDFETFPWLFGTEGDPGLALREIAAGSPGAYPEQDVYEHVLDMSSDGGASIFRDFPQGQDWSASKGLSLWYEGQGDGGTVTVDLADDGAPDPGPEGWEQVWSDEFDAPAGTPADPTKWTYETGGWGWGNDELQYYTDSTDNAAHDGEGNMVVTAREVDPATTELQCWYGPCTHTSARLVTEQKAEFTHGRIETRVKVPRGAGIWPAVWALGTDFRAVGWPDTGEIDIMEFVGKFPDEVFGTIHGPGYSGGESYGDTYVFDTPFYEEWHTVAVEWTPEQILWFVDGTQFHTATPEDLAGDEWVFEHPFSLITNVAVGGNFGGPLGDDLELPQSLTLDYIRVFQGPDTAERFEAQFVDDRAGWREVVVPFDSFTRSAEQPAGAPDDGLTLTDVQGYGFAVAGASDVSLDRVLLVDELPVVEPPVDVPPVVEPPVDVPPVVPPVTPVVDPTPAPGGPPVASAPPNARIGALARTGSDGVGTLLAVALLAVALGGGLYGAVRWRHGREHRRS